MRDSSQSFFKQTGKLKNTKFSIFLLCFLILSFNSYAQKGAGNRTGVAREGNNSEFISFTGKIYDIKDGPCVSSTGRYDSGSHIILEIFSDCRLNIHVGPTEEVGYIMNKLSVGDEITVLAFNTPELKLKHYIAKEIKTDNRKYVIRDETLRPFWAGKW